MDKIKWLVFSVAVVGFLAFITTSSKEPEINLKGVDIGVAQVASSINGNIADHVKGNPDSKVILIEYADFQCPGCASASPIIRVLVNNYKDQIKYIFRSFPLTSIHNNAKSSASAVEAAGLQNKYWEMHYKMFETQTDWESLGIAERTDYYVNMAKSFNLDTEKFKSDMSSKEVEAKIKFNLALAKESKIQETPTFMLNGKLIDSKIWGDDAKFKKLLNDELAKYNVEPPIITE